mmetsp:Transcript_30108/g.63410  ORF Transcript_30108/g.63410 Transcript_30108/m.63410 type:complete len:223 (+) Transcript_30108:469-1137(+)
MPRLPAPPPGPHAPSLLSPRLGPLPIHLPRSRRSLLGPFHLLVPLHSLPRRLEGGTRAEHPPSFRGAQDLRHLHPTFQTQFGQGQPRHHGRRRRHVEAPSQFGQGGLHGKGGEEHERQRLGGGQSIRPLHPRRVRRRRGRKHRMLRRRSARHLQVGHHRRLRPSGPGSRFRMHFLVVSNSRRRLVRCDGGGFQRQDDREEFVQSHDTVVLVAHREESRVCVS